MTTATTIRLRPQQRAFIVQVTKERATDLSEFVRLCVDHSAMAVASSIPLRIKVKLNSKRLSRGRQLQPMKVVSMRTLKSVRKKARRAA